MVGGTWEAPLYQTVRKLPFIPKETEIDQLIAGCSKRMATFLQMLKETGARCGEIWQLKWDRHRLRKQSRKHNTRKKQQPTSRTPKQQTHRNAQTPTKKLRRKSLFTSTHASRQPRSNTFNAKENDIAHKLRQPTTTKNPLPHLQILERHNALPQTQRHVLRHATA